MDFIQRLPQLRDNARLYRREILDQVQSRVEAGHDIDRALLLAEIHCVVHGEMPHRATAYVRTLRKKAVEA